MQFRTLLSSLDIRGHELRNRAVISQSPGQRVRHE